MATVHLLRVMLIWIKGVGVCVCACVFAFVCVRTHVWWHKTHLVMLRVYAKQSGMRNP